MQPGSLVLNSALCKQQYISYTNNHTFSHTVNFSDVEIIENNSVMLCNSLLRYNAEKIEMVQISHAISIEQYLTQ